MTVVLVKENQWLYTVFKEENVEEWKVGKSQQFQRNNGSKLAIDHVTIIKSIE